MMEIQYISNSNENAKVNCKVESDGIGPMYLCVLILKATGAAEQNGDGLRD